MTPMQGEGGNSALEDALVVADAIKIAWDSSSLDVCLGLPYFGCLLSPGLGRAAEPRDLEAKFPSCDSVAGSCSYVHANVEGRVCDEERFHALRKRFDGHHAATLTLSNERFRTHTSACAKLEQSGCSHVTSHFSENTCDELA